MKPSFWCWCALALALSSAAPAQQEPPIELAPLLPAKPAQPAKKKAKKKGAEPQEPPLALPQPPLDAQLPLEPLRAPSSVGVVVERGALAEATAAQMGESLRTIAKLAPGVKEASVLSPQSCIDDECWATMARAQKVDQVAIATWSNGSLRVRLVDGTAKKQVGQAAGPATTDPLEAAAAAEALLCGIMVPAGCTGEAAVDAAPDVQVELDGRALAPGEKRRVAVGVHELKLTAGTHVVTRPLPVLQEGRPTLYARQVGGEPRLLTAAELPAHAAVPASAIASSPPEGRRTWTRTAGYVSAGAAVAVAAAGVYFGAKSRSDINQAESAYSANGGVYRTSDLAVLDSGNSKAHTANALFIASGVLLATAAVFTFAF